METVPPTCLMFDSLANQAFQPLTSGKESFDLLLPHHSSSEGAPFLVEIPPYSGLSPMNLNASEQVPSLTLDTTLNVQTSPPPASFCSKPNSLKEVEDGSKRL